MLRPAVLRHCAPLALAFVALAAPACESDSPIPAPTPAPVTSTETFTGTLNMNGAATFPFSATVAGSVTGSLDKVEPDATIAVGLALGTWNGTTCNIILANDNALQGASIVGSATSPAALCIRIYDVGKVPGAAPVAFTISVIHP